MQVAEAINYLHSKHFVYRDLKPGNILVFKFPEPDTQWNSNIKILVKVADYGISKQVSPEGLRGGLGTPPYLPPEVNLTGGRAAASTMIDVYAFGMFIYYLMTFMAPFETEVRPLCSLLEEGRRPELPPKVWLSNCSIIPYHSYNLNDCCGESHIQDLLLYSSIPSPFNCMS